jgi:FKBP-type peptidyl-prolyl cis-trans isomerase 2
MRSFLRPSRAAIVLLGLSLATVACGGSDRAAAEGDGISVHYVGTLDDGTQFDSSRDRGAPFAVVIGSGGTIAGFDAAVRGMEIGDVKTVRIPARDAYGEWDQTRVIDVPMTDALAGITVGDSVTSSAGQSFPVVRVTDETVQIDTNHPLAGQALTFEIELLSFDD